jgi:hypothetical protein
MGADPAFHNFSMRARLAGMPTPPAAEWMRGFNRSVKKAEGQAFIDWLTSPEGQKAIADYQVNGQPLFFPNANVPGP